jgi:hypothetical protein
MEFTVRSLRNQSSQQVLFTVHFQRYREIHLEKLDETKRKLQHHDLRSFVLKFGSTWITNGNAGPIVIVQKYVKDGTTIIDAHYLNYDMIERSISLH